MINNSSKGGTEMVEDVREKGIESGEKEVAEGQVTQIDDMFSDFFPEEESGGAEDDKVTDGEEKVVEAEKDIEGEGTEETEAEKVIEGDKAAGEEEEIVVEKKVEKSAEVEVEVEVDLAEQNKLLLQRIEELSGGVVTPKPSVAAVEDASKAADLIKFESVPDIVADFIGDANIDDIVSDKKLFNEVLFKVATATRENTIKTMLMSIPGIIVKQTENQGVIKSAIDEFFGANEDLKPVRKYLGAVANQIYSESPGKKLAVILDEAAVKTRTLLGLKKQAEKKVEASERKRKPALVKKVGGGNRGNEKPDTSDLQKDINETLGI